MWTSISSIRSFAFDKSASTEPFVGFSSNLEYKVLTKGCRGGASFVKIGTLTVILYCTAPVRLYPTYLYDDLNEIRCRRLHVMPLREGNGAYYANKPLFKSKLVSRNSKLKLYLSIIRPIVVYGCETWVLKENTRQRLSVFERKMLRKIFGPTKEHNGTWRIKTNKELDELIQHRSIVNYVTSQRLSWFGHK